MQLAVDPSGRRRGLLCLHNLSSVLVSLSEVPPIYLSKTQLLLHQQWLGIISYMSRLAPSAYVSGTSVVTL